MNRSAILGPLTLATLSRQLAAARRQGPRMLAVLQILAEDNLWPKRARQRVLQPVGETVAEDLMCDVPRLLLPYPSAAIDLLVAAEREGVLTETLEALADDLDSQEKTRSAVQVAVFWPFTAFLVLIVVLIVSDMFVLPSFEYFYHQSGVSIPAATQLARGLDNWTVGLWWLWLPVFGLLFFVSLTGRWSPRFKSRMAGCLFALPFVRRYLTDRYVLRTTRWLKVLLAGSSLNKEILTYLRDTQLVPALQRSTSDFAEALRSGADYSVAMAGPRLPRRLALFLKAGEASSDVAGALDMLLAVTAAAEQESRARFERGVLLTSYAIVGFMVALFVWGMYGSISSLATGL